MKSDVFVIFFDAKLTLGVKNVAAECQIGYYLPFPV